jgi:hypothetical protein
MAHASKNSSVALCFTDILDDAKTATKTLIYINSRNNEALGD